MNQEELLRNIAAANRDVVGGEPVPEEPATAPPVAPVDIYQQRQYINRDYAKKRFPRGARAQVNATVEDVVNGAGANSLAQSYERAKDDSEALKNAGENIRAQLVINQYMNERFLPAVEVVVNFTSPDELLNSEQALKTLDKYALGIGSMSGYTAAYVREAYGSALGQMESQSEPSVTNAVMRINGLADTDQIRAACGLAKKLKGQIDKGEMIASEQDYDLISRVASAL